MNKAYAIAVILGCVACSGDEPGDGSVICNDDEDECSCSGGKDCNVPCAGDDACILGCEDFAGTCNLTCDDGCDLTCNNGPTCNMTCGGDCLLNCREAHDCTATCAENCVYECANAATCAVTAGANSSITCQEGSTCNVTCTGACRLHCEDIGSCNLLCPGSLSRATCNDGFACGNC